MKRSLLHLALLIFGTLSIVGQDRYIVHEWGTFTSVQGSDGVLQPWRPLRTAELPAFVHDWMKPGLGVYPTVLPPGGKGGLVTLQRMETPVDYFYSDKVMNADVDIAFPPGLITEWYPQPSELGPSLPQPPRWAQLLFTNWSSNSIPSVGQSLTNSRIVWRHLTLTPVALADSQWTGRLPVAGPGKNYFAARDTDSDFVQTEAASHGGTNELEKFLFYRGAGTFETPLNVSLNPDRTFAVANTGADALAHLFFVRIKDGYGEFSAMDSLPAGQTNQQAGYLSSGPDWQRLPLAQFQDAISGQMAAALTGAGLYDREAKAMVNTWRDSWFGEEGLRVLYILPRSWTDLVLPMKLDPQPKDLVRVMVGRAEIIPSETQTQLWNLLTQANDGNANARSDAKQMFKKLGRFGSPALTLAVGNNYTNAAAILGYHLLDETMVKPN